jgi:hypothetical protein
VGEGQEGKEYFGLMHPLGANGLRHVSFGRKSVIRTARLGVP